MALVAGIDLGTQSTKVVVYDADKKEIACRAQAPHDIIAAPDGTREQKASWWIDAVTQCFAQLPESVKKDIKALGVSGQQHGFVPLSDGGQVLYNVKLWNDTSTAKECDEIHRALGGDEEAMRLAGNPVLPGYTASKVLWLKKNHPSIFKQIATILLPHDYLNFYLTGERVMEYGDASGTGLFDVRRRTWCEPLCRAIDREKGLEALLPPFVEPTQPAGQVSAKAAAALGIPAGALVSCGGGDNMMGAFGTGAVKNGVLVLSLGTSGTMYGFADKPIVPPGGEFAAFCSSSGGWLPLVCTLNCAGAVANVREMVGVELDDFDGLLTGSEPGADGMICLPYFDGERTPNLPAATASLMGMTTSNFCKENVVRAAVEATVFGLKIGYDEMRRAGIRANEIRVIGGGSNSKPWLQIIADIFEMNAVVPVEQEACAFGAALQALFCRQNATGERIAVEDLVADHLPFDPDKSVAPIGENTGRYAEIFGRYGEHLTAVTPLFR